MYTKIIIYVYKNYNCNLDILKYTVFIKTLKYIKIFRRDYKDTRESEDYVTVTSNNVPRIDKSCQFACEQMKQDTNFVLVGKYLSGNGTKDNLMGNMLRIENRPWKRAH